MNQFFKGGMRNRFSSFSTDFITPFKLNKKINVRNKKKLKILGGSENESFL
jgi:hypothetical protein